MIAQLPLLAIAAPFYFHMPAVLSQVNSSNSMAQISERITVKVESAIQGSGISAHKNG